MAAVIVKHDEQGTPQVNGEHNFEFALLMGDRTILADTRTELVAAIIDTDGSGDEYLRLAEGENAAEDTSWSRYVEMTRLAPYLAELVLVSAMESGTVSAHEMDADALNTIIAPDRLHGEPFVGEWNDDRVPLILIRADYEPFTDRPLPSGNVKFLDPSTETTFIDSLVEAGVCELLVKAAV